MQENDTSALPQNTQPALLGSGETGEAIAVLGGGSWGTALAMLLAEAGRRVTLWDRSAELADSIQSRRVNARYLPGIALPDNLAATSRMAEAVTPATSWVIVAVASPGIRPVASELKSLLARDCGIVIATKGLEAGSGMTVSEILSGCLSGAPHAGLVALSGPNLAQEVIRRVPTVAVAASDIVELARRAQKLLSIPRTFRVYTHGDVRGVELAGALKNVLAIGAGISDGLGFGDNTKAALMTRGLMEMSRLGLAAGANALTFLGLAGVGDLMATANSRLSRNYRVGAGLAQGKTLPEILSGLGQVAEGVTTSQAAQLLLGRYQTEAPLFETLYAVIHQGKSPSVAVEELMTRPAKDEYG